MTEMIISHDIISFVTKKLCKFIISSDVLHHSMADLKDSLHFFLRFPFDRMDFCVSVF